jgi:hypothetical protein
MISATQQMLEDKLAMWHGTTAQAKRYEILRTCFP